MTDLRKAAEMALEVMSKEPESFTLWVEDMRQAREALRQALAQPEQEQYVTKVVAMHEDGTYTTERIPLPKRKWVGLTDEEIDTWNIVGHESLREFVRAIEAKLKEKNT